jgi:hypothetical protein
MPPQPGSLEGAAAPPGERGLAAVAGVTAAGAALGVLGRAWLAPPDHLLGLALLPIWGLALGVLARWLHPGWKARALGIAGLAAAGLSLNLAWLSGPHAVAADAPLALRARSDLLTRSLESWHPLIATRSLPLALRRLVDGREVRWVPTPLLTPRRLLVLAEAARLVEMEPPGPWLPGPDAWSARYETLYLSFDERRAGGVVRHRMVGVTEGAEDAAWIAVLEHEGAILAIPDAVWESERRRAAAEKESAR